MCEPILSETDAPPRRRSLTLATPQKSFLRIFYFARARFFLPRLRRGFGGQVKGKENFFAGLCSERAGRRGFASARARRNSPHTPLPPRPRFRRRFFRRTQNLLSIFSISLVILSIVVLPKLIVVPFWQVSKNFLASKTLSNFAFLTCSEFVLV